MKRRKLGVADSEQLGRRRARVAVRRCGRGGSLPAKPPESDAARSRWPGGAPKHDTVLVLPPTDGMASTAVSYSDEMSVTRIVPNLPVADVSNALELYRDIFGFDIGMDLGWVGNLAPTDSRTAQLQVMTRDSSAPCNPAISIGVESFDEVDAIYQRVLAVGLDIVHPLTDEPWGVRRFFFRDRDGNVVNVIAHH